MGRAGAMRDERPARGGHPFTGCAAFVHRRLAFTRVRTEGWSRSARVLLEANLRFDGGGSGAARAVHGQGFYKSRENFSR